jgi:hypothetical protein
VIYAIMAQIIGKEIIFFTVPPSVGTPVFTYVEETDDAANKVSQRPEAHPAGERMEN